MALKCTNTSAPPGWEIQPKPLSALNHFTVPVATVAIPLLVVVLRLRGLPSRAVVPYESQFPLPRTLADQFPESRGEVEIVRLRQPAGFGAGGGVFHRPAQGGQAVADG